MRRRFLAAKVNINGSIYSSNLSTLINLIPEAIKSDPKLYLGKTNWQWVFADIEQDPDANFVWGNFVKSRKEKKLILKGTSTELYELPHPAAYQSFFVYDFVSEILLFEETSFINRDEFIFAFEKIIFNSKYEIGEISIQLFPIKDVIYREIMSMDVLTKIEFDLIQSNPISDDTYKDLDDIIQKERATRFKAVFENPNGLNKEGHLITSGIEKVSKGSGSINAYGYSRVQTYGKKRKYLRKKSHKFKSKDSVHMTHADRNINKSDLVNQLKKFADSIKSLLF